ncbi:isochorismatase family protein, partial [Candidatus Woesearchaeota archaeon]|nr:isochorismatase family protein [Candidatus Woesearchaeota archaeon]
GVNTPLCIDTTVRSGFSRGYNILVPRDLVAMSASLPGNQQASLELFHRFFGTVTDARTIVDYLKKNK